MTLGILITPYIVKNRWNLTVNKGKMHTTNVQVFKILIENVSKNNICITREVGKAGLFKTFIYYLEMEL